MLSVSSTIPKNLEDSSSIHLVFSSGLSYQKSLGTTGLVTQTTDDQEEEEKEANKDKNDNVSKTESTSHQPNMMKTETEATSTDFLRIGRKKTKGFQKLFFQSSNYEELRRNIIRS